MPSPLTLRNWIKFKICCVAIRNSNQRWTSLIAELRNLKFNLRKLIRLTLLLPVRTCHPPLNVRTDPLRLSGLIWLPLHHRPIQPKLLDLRLPLLRPPPNPRRVQNRNPNVLSLWNNLIVFIQLLMQLMATNFCTSPHVDVNASLRFAQVSTYSVYNRAGFLTSTTLRTIPLAS